MHTILKCTYCCKLRCECTYYSKLYLLYLYGKNECRMLKLIMH